MSTEERNWAMRIIDETNSNRQEFSDEYREEYARLLDPSRPWKVRVGGKMIGQYSTEANAELDAGLQPDGCAVDVYDRRMSYTELTTAEIVKANRSETVKAARRIIKEEEETVIPSHGSAEDSGSADRYYGRRYDPHYYVGNTYNSERIQENKLTDEDRRLYKKGWEEETDRKDWG